ncbi:methionine gamma-lyase [Azospirillum sp.]|uniref:methionine gamma-lyase n=1 Tax=Azospirillum sp. TaxID=34012 RepID=UPI00260D26CB|nr:methionine gamma-lyase [Azospirillum sp.]
MSSSLKPSSPAAGFATRAIHHGYDPMQHNGALVPPVYMTSTFAFPDAATGGQRFAGEGKGYIYTRLGNPTLNLLEERLAILEGGEAALATASGMGAITSALWTIVQPGDEVIVDKTLYGCTFSFLRHGLARFGVTVTHVDLTDVANLESALSDKTRVVYFETPANPNMRVVDIAAVAAAAHRRGALVMVDNTYCTPLLQRPLELGADLVVHSATKYLGGHGDLTAGAVIGGAELLGRIRMVGLKDMTGAVLSASDANLILRGLKTLELRMERHCSSARLAADLIAAHPAVKAVHFPGLPSHPQHAVAKRQMSDFGGMIAFELIDGYAGGLRFMDALRLVTRAVSLGDAETLVQHPASMTHSTYTAEERALYGISDGLVRLSVGLETPADLLADLSQALDHAGVAMSVAAE